MSIRLLTALGLALAASTARAQYPADDPIQFVAHCTFEQDGAEALWRLCGFGPKENAEALFTKHAQAHGWRGIEGPDLADLGRSARCPVWILDQLAGVGGVPCSSGDNFLDRAVAVMLERNGRAADALRVLDSAIEDSKLGDMLYSSSRNQFVVPARWGARDGYQDTSFVSQCAAKIAARAGQWERALDFAKDWTPSNDCGDFREWETAEIQLFRARCLVGLRRSDDAVAIAREGACNQGWALGPARDLVGLWLECLVSSRRARNPAAALDMILPEIPVEAHDTCREGLRFWELSHMPRTEQLAHLEELTGFDPDAALAVLMSSGSLAIVARLGALEVIDGKLREPVLSGVLSETGHPDVGPVLQQASERVPNLEYELNIWTRANERWNALAVAR